MDLRDFESELNRLKSSKMQEKSKKKITDFLSYLQNREELSYDRLYFYADKLRIIAELMGDSFCDPSDKDVENALNRIKSKKTKWGNANGESSMLSDWTVEGYKTTFKKFYHWIGKDSAVSWIKRNNRPNYKKKPDFVIKQEEVDLLVQACDNLRDKAIFTLFYDSGIRLEELLTLKMKDVEFDDYGMKILVSGKTSSRSVRVYGDSVGYLRQWMNAHPDPFNQEAWLFCGIGHNKQGESNWKEPMNKSMIYSLFRKVKTRAVRLGFPESKRLNPHKFRHNRATELSTKVREPVLERQMGWIPSSRMTRIYVHLNDQDTDNAILEAAGIKVVKKQTESRKSRLCLKCKSLNPSPNKFCFQCGSPLDIDQLQLLESGTGEIITALKKTNELTDIERNLLNVLSPDSVKEVLLESLKRLKREGKLQEVADNL